MWHAVLCVTCMLFFFQTRHDLHNEKSFEINLVYCKPVCIYFNIISVAGYLVIGNHSSKLTKVVMFFFFISEPADLIV